MAATRTRSTSSSRKKTDDPDPKQNDQTTQDAAFVPDEVEQFEKPDATVKAEQAARDRQDEVKDIQIEARNKNLVNVPSQPVTTAYATQKEEGKDPGSITFALAGQVVIVEATDKELRFEREDFLQLLRAINQIGPSL